MTWRYHGACRNPLSDCRNGTVGLLEVTVGLLSDCRITVGVHCRTVGPGLRLNKVVINTVSYVLGGAAGVLRERPVCLRMGQLENKRYHAVSPTPMLNRTSIEVISW
jgi:hypothetical protein